MTYLEQDITDKEDGNDSLVLDVRKVEVLLDACKSRSTVEAFRTESS